MQKTKIEYLDYTWNITHGCSPVSEGCTNCWAKSMSKRLAGVGVRGYDSKNSFRPTFCPWKLTEPQEIKKPSLVGISFMGDLFHERISHSDRNSVFEAMDVADWHSYLLLTKRPDIALDFDRWREESWLGYPHSPWKKHIWLGVTVELEKYLWRVEELLKIPAVKHFVSLEPLLSEINIEKYLHCGIDWCIIGSESGPNARPMEELWVKKLVEQCKENKIAIFYKQQVIKGKKVSLPKLDGKQFVEFPQTTDKQNES